MQGWSKPGSDPMLSHNSRNYGRGMKQWCKVPAFFADLRHRPLGGRYALGMERRHDPSSGTGDCRFLRQADPSF